MSGKLNQIERDIIEKKLDDAYNFIRSQNSIKKSDRDHDGIENARKVRDTMERWINADNSIKEPRPVKKSSGDAIFETIGGAIKAGQDLTYADAIIGQVIDIFDIAITRESRKISEITLDKFSGIR
jgi:hypothetical protein